MEQSLKSNCNIGHSFYSKLIQEDENMKARLKAILNQIHENRVAVKELHTEFGLKFSETIIPPRNQIEDHAEHYDKSVEDLIARRNKILEMSSKVINNS